MSEVGEGRSEGFPGRCRRLSVARLWTPFAENLFEAVFRYQFCGSPEFSDLLCIISFCGSVFFCFECIFSPACFIRSALR